METVMITAEEAKRISDSHNHDDAFEIIMAKIKERAVEGKRSHVYRVKRFQDGFEDDASFDRIYSRLRDLGYKCSRYESCDYKDIRVTW